MLACLAAGPEHDSGDLLFLTAWQDEQALRAFAGPDLGTSVLPTGYQHLLAHHAVTHRPLLAPIVHA